MLRRELTPVLVSNLQDLVINSIKQSGALRYKFKLLSLRIGVYFWVDKVVVLVHIDPGPRGP